MAELFYFIKSGNKENIMTATSGTTLVFDVF